MYDLLLSLEIACMSAESHHYKVISFKSPLLRGIDLQALLGPGQAGNLALPLSRQQVHHRRFGRPLARASVFCRLNKNKKHFR